MASKLLAITGTFDVPSSEVPDSSPIGCEPLRRCPSYLIHLARSGRGCITHRLFASEQTSGSRQRATRGRRHRANCRCRTPKSRPIVAGLLRGGGVAHANTAVAVARAALDADHRRNS